MQHISFDLYYDSILWKNYRSMLRNKKKLPVDGMERITKLMQTSFPSLKIVKDDIQRRIRFLQRKKNVQRIQQINQTLQSAPLPGVAQLLVASPKIMNQILPPIHNEPDPSHFEENRTQSISNSEQSSIIDIEEIYSPYSEEESELEIDEPSNEKDVEVSKLLNKDVVDDRELNSSPQNNSKQINLKPLKAMPQQTIDKNAFSIGGQGVPNWQKPDLSKRNNDTNMALIPAPVQIQDTIISFEGNK